jgi:hypothetical protein
MFAIYHSSEMKFGKQNFETGSGAISLKYLIIVPGVVSWYRS